MWKGYSSKVRDRWTPLIGLAPRWITANGYSDVGDPLFHPALQAWGTGRTYTAPSSGLIPPDWVLTEPVVLGVNESPFSIPRDPTEKRAYLEYIYDFGFRGLRWATQTLDPVLNNWFTIAEVEAHELDNAAIWLEHADNEYIKVLINNNYGVETAVSSSIWNLFLSEEQNDDLHARTALISCGLRTNHAGIKSWLITEAERLANYFYYQRISLELANPDVILWFTDFIDPLNLNTTGLIMCNLLAPGSAIVDPRDTLDSIRAQMYVDYPGLVNRRWVDDGQFIYKEPTELKIQPLINTPNIIEVGATEVGGLSDALIEARGRHPSKIYIFCFRPPGYEYWFWTDQPSAALSHSNAYAFWPNRLDELTDGIALIPRSGTSASDDPGNILQIIFENCVFEMEKMRPTLTSLFLSRGNYFDTSDPEFAWTFEQTTPLDTLKAQLTDYTYVNITKADGDLDFFMSGDWRWAQNNNNIFIYGIGLQPQDSEDRDTDNWQFISSLELYTSGSILFMEHPYTRHWIPVHPTQVREDGLLDINFDHPIRLRTGLSTAWEDLDYCTVLADGVVKYARRIPLWNSLDEKGLWSGLERRDNESNLQFAPFILWSNWFSTGQTKLDIQNYLSNYLRTSTLISVDREDSSFSVPSDAVSYTIMGEKQYRFFTEDPLNPDPDNSIYFRSKVASGELGCLYINGRETSYSLPGSSKILPERFIDSNYDYGYIRWRETFWTESGSTVVFSPNFTTQGPELQILFAKKVRVDDPDDITLKRSFNRTSPTFRWRSLISFEDLREINSVSGLAEFE